MAEALTIPERMNVAEFLRWNPGGDTRYELIEGQPVMMNPPKLRHADVEDNLGGILRPLLRRPCRLLSNVGVLLDEETDTYLEADLALSCEPRRPDQQHVLEPRMIVEVLSPSTRSVDFTHKLPRYWDLPSLQEILFVSSTERSVRHWWRDGQSWVMATVIGKGAVRLSTVEVTADLDEIYRDVVF